MNLKIIYRLVLTAFFWGLNFHLAKWAVGPLPFELVALVRYAIASLCFLVLSPIPLATLRKSLATHGRYQFLLAFLGIFGYAVLFFLAIPHTSPVNAALLMATNPLLTVLFSKGLLQTQVRPVQWMGLALALGGIVLIISGGRWEIIKHLKFGWGDALLVLASALFALTNVVNRKYLSGADSNTTAALTTYMTTALCLLLVMVTAPAVAWMQTGPGPWLAVFLLGALGSYVAHRFWYQGIRTVGADTAAYFLNLVPFFAALIAVFTGTAITGVQWIGGALIMAGILISLTKKSTHETDKAVLVGCKA